MTLEAQSNPARLPQESGFTRVDTDSSHIIRDTVRNLNQHIIGQDEAVHAVASAILRAKAQMTNPKQPFSTLMFLGRTGVGKTEMAKAAAKVLYGNQWEEHFKLVDCTSLSESQNVTKITGGSPEYVGYGDPLLISPDFLNQEGGAILVFDEFEKAHPSVQKLLIPILQEGKMTVYVPTGRPGKSGSRSQEIAPIPLTFNNVHIVFTSNIGTEALNQAHVEPLGFHTAASSEQPNNKKIVLQELRRRFSSTPELLGRIGEQNVVVFNDLGPREYSLIFDKTISDINVNQRGIKTPIEITQGLKEWLIKNAVGNGRHGARDIEHVIENYVLTKVAEGRASGVLRDGSSLLLDLESNGKDIGLWTKPAEAIPLPAAVSIGENQRILPAPVNRESTLPSESERAISRKERGVPFKIKPSFKMVRDAKTGKNIEQIKVRVGGVGIVFVQIIESTPKAQDNSTVIFASGETHLYTLAVRIEANSFDKIPVCKINIPVGRYDGISRRNIVNGIHEVNISKWKNKDGKTSPLVFTRTDFESLEIIVNRMKAIH